VLEERFKGLMVLQHPRACRLEVCLEFYEEEVAPQVVNTAELLCFAFFVVGRLLRTYS